MIHDEAQRPGLDYEHALSVALEDLVHTHARESEMTSSRPSAIKKPQEPITNVSRVGQRWSAEDSLGLVLSEHDGGLNRR